LQKHRDDEKAEELTTDKDVIDIARAAIHYG